MKKTFKTLSVLLVMCLAAYSGYVYGKHKRQQELDLQLQLINFSTWATDIEVDLGLLEMLNEQKNLEAKDKIETYLDVTLASLGNYEHFAQKYPDPGIFEAIKKAMKYRQKIGGHTVHPKLSRGVEQAFNIVE